MVDANVLLPPEETSRGVGRPEVVPPVGQVLEEGGEEAETEALVDFGVLAVAVVGRAERNIHIGCTYVH